MKNFDFNADYILEDDRVILRPLTLSDVENLLHFSMNEHDLWKFSSMPAIGKEGLIHYIEVALKAREEGKEYPFIVFDKQANSYAGSTRFYDIQCMHATTQLGFTWYGKKFHGTGLNKHCKFLLLQFAFDTMQFERVEFRADNNNLRSIAAMKSIGCVVEGILRSHTIKPDGDRRDSIVLSILKAEWIANGREALRKKMEPQ